MTTDDRHHISLSWQRNTPEFTYNTFDRTHTVKFNGGETVTMSASPGYYGNAAYANPEELLLGAVSSCYMLTFLALAAKFGFVVNSYQDAATAVLMKNESGKFYVGEILLQPKVIFQKGKELSEQILQQLRDKAHEYCFIANSICTKINIELNATAE